MKRKLVFGLSTAAVALVGTLLLWNQLKRSNDKPQHPSASDRASAATALGHLEDAQATEQLEKLLKDPDVNVRVEAIRALGFTSLPARQKLIEQLLEKIQELTLEEKIAALSARLQPGAPDELREDTMTKLLEIASSEADLAKAAAAAVAAMSLSPKNPKLVKFLQSTRNPKIRPLAVKHLSVIGDSWIQQRLRRLMEDQDPQVRLAAVQSVFLACPTDRWALLEKAMTKDPSPEVRAAAKKIHQETEEAYTGDPCES